MSEGENRAEDPTAIARQLRLVTDLLETHNVEHWVDCGTLLGIVRDGQPLPGDKDVDLGLWEKDLDALQGLAPRFHEIGYKIYGFQYDGMTYGVNVRSVQEQGVTVSFGVYRQHGDHAWRMASYLAPNPHRRWSPAFFLRGMFRFPVRRVARKMRLKTDIAHLCRTWPYSKIVRVATWWVPLHLIHPIKRMPASGYWGPADPESLLAAHYGKWRQPVSDYIWWRDDLLVQHKTPEQIMAEHPISDDSAFDLNSPGRPTT